MTVEEIEKLKEENATLKQYQKIVEDLKKDGFESVASVQGHIKRQLKTEAEKQELVKQLKENKSKFVSILIDIEKDSDFCKLCEKKGSEPVTCPYMKNYECAYELLRLYEIN